MGKKIDPSEMFKVLSVETRVKMLDLLKSKGPLGAKSMAESIGISPAAVSQHLKILKQAGLVNSERKGYWIPYTVDEDALECCRQVLNEVCTCGCQGTCNFGDKVQDESDLKSLKQYEAELKSRIRMVREKIKAIESQKSK
jgi:DNA-binding transcriptional ArsR family regulator